MSRTLSTRPRRGGPGAAREAWKFPGLPRHWIRVLGRQPESHPESHIEGLPGHLRLDTPQAVLFVPAVWPGFREGEPNDSQRD